MKITNAELADLFYSSLLILSNTKIKNAKIQYAIMRTHPEVKKAFEIYGKTRENMLSDSAIKDEKGKPVIKDKKYQFETPEIEEKTLSDIGVLRNIEVEIPIHGVSIMEFEGVDIEPSVLMNLKDFILKPEPV